MQHVPVSFTRKIAMAEKKAKKSDISTEKDYTGESIRNRLFGVLCLVFISCGCWHSVDVDGTQVTA